MPLVFASYCHCLKSTDPKSILTLNTVIHVCIFLFKIKAKIAASKYQINFYQKQGDSRNESRPLG